MNNLITYQCLNDADFDSFYKRQILTKY